VEACRNVPVVIAGGKKLPEMDALKMAFECNIRRRCWGGYGRKFSRVTARLE